MSDPNRARSVLVTGCSTGIGRATAIRLAARGWSVYATARRPDSICDLASDGCRLLRLDVTEPESMREAVSAVEDAQGAVDVLVNNAGYGAEGAVEEMPVDEIRRQFETNLFGPTYLTQLVVPGMRRRHWGRIVNVSSVGGRITIPGGGAYHASKHALEALSDALRFELAGFGIAVVVVEPGAIRTRWVDTATTRLAERASSSGPYAEFHAAVARQLDRAHEGILSHFAGGPDDAARVIERAVTARRPRARYVVPPVARLFIASRRLLPDRLWDLSMRRRFPQPKAGVGADDDEPSVPDDGPHA